MSNSDAKKVVIAGAGFGGLAAAHRLRKLMPDAQVTVIDRAAYFAMGFRKTDEVLGRAPLSQTSRPLANLKRFGIEFVQAGIEEIDPDGLSVTAAGKRYDADALLLALGAETAPEAIPGLDDHGFDVYSHGGARAAGKALEDVAKGTRIVVSVFGAPYKCPPAPFELALLLQGQLMDRKVKISLVTPLEMSIPILGQSGCDVIEGRLAGLLIDLHRGVAPVAVHDKEIELADGRKIDYDILLAVPPHRVPSVVSDAGLAPEGGWVKVDARTMATQKTGVWAVGDMTALQMNNGKPLPKAGAFAQGGGEVAAAQIAAFLGGPAADERFEAHGTCYLETGDGEAMMVTGHFLAEPMPEVELTPSSVEAMAQKDEYEQRTLRAWFGE
jgi:sulfide:quinone oxidoreductase